MVTAVLGLASADEQSVLPYGQTLEGQQGGHGASGVGGSIGHAGLGAVFAPNFQAPCEHCAIRVPHRPKSHVVPSGSRHSLPAGGSAFGHSGAFGPPESSPPSGSSAVLKLSLEHALASAAPADAIASATASCASGPVRRGVSTRSE